MSKQSVAVSEFSRSDARSTRFSGIRSDRHLGNMEIWLEGVMKEDVSAEEVAVNPKAVVNAYARAFGFAPDNVKLLGLDVTE